MSPLASIMFRYNHSIKTPIEKSCIHIIKDLHKNHSQNNPLTTVKFLLFNSSDLVHQETRHAEHR